MFSLVICFICSISGVYVSVSLWPSPGSVVFIFPIGLRSSLDFPLTSVSLLLSFRERPPLIFILGPRQERAGGLRELWKKGTSLEFFLTGEGKEAGDPLVLFYFLLPYKRQHTDTKVLTLTLLRERACDWSNWEVEGEVWLTRSPGGQRPQMKELSLGSHLRLPSDRSLQVESNAWRM